MVLIVPIVTERIESVKAGIVGAGAFAIAQTATIVAKTTIVNLIAAYSTTVITLNWQLLLQIAIGAVSGFLFGVTYRYIIRGDRNSHLNDGAVLAFGLVRGLALVESNFIFSELLSVLFIVIQSIIYFAIARLVLDLAIDYKLIKPFI